MRIDLHNHTINSDGHLTCEELVLAAKDAGIKVFAKTDHDNTFGDDEIYEIGKKYGISVIKGMELSTFYKGESVHIILLFKNNIVPNELSLFSRNYIEARNARAINMMKKIKEIYGFEYDLDKLITGTGTITRANMLDNLELCNKSYTRQKLSFTVTKESKAYIPFSKLSTEEGVKLGRKVDAFVIFAHPCLLKNRSYVEEILEYGVDAMEVRYPSPKNDEEYFTKLCEKYHILKSAGSDFHMFDDLNVDHGNIGTCTISEEEFEPIRKILNFNE